MSELHVSYNYKRDTQVNNHEVLSPDQSLQNENGHTRIS
jgi:hypothetical protein